MSTPERWTAVVPSPFGMLGLRRDAAGLCEVRFLRTGRARAPRDPLLRRVAGALRRYFEGVPLPASIPLSFGALPPFQLRVLQTLREVVPPGRTVTYGELAALSGRPGASRAVGTAMARNPLPLFVPCHRVVAASGLGGFGWGLDAKRGLLALEGFISTPALADHGSGSGPRRSARETDDQRIRRHTAAANGTGERPRRRR